MTDFQKKILLIIFINLVLWGVLNSKTDLVVIGLINLLIVVVLNMNEGPLSNFYSNLLGYFSKTNELKNKFGNYFSIFISLKDNIIILLNVLYYFIRHYIFILSFIIFIAAFLEKYLLNTFNLDFNYSLIIFIFCLIVIIKDAYKGVFYFGRKILTLKDLFFILSLELVYFLYLFSKDLGWYFAYFIGVLGGTVFYISSLTIFDLTKYKHPLKLISVQIYMLLTLILGVIFCWNYYPKFQNLFVREKIVYQEVVKEVPVEKIVEKIVEKQVYVNNISGDINTGIALVIQTGAAITGQSIQTGVSNNIDNISPNKKLTFRDVVPYIVNKYNLKEDRLGEVNFNQIKKTDSIYKSFLIAYNYRMFGKDINPDANITCKTMMVFIGLAQNWKVEYTKDNVLDIYWEEAMKKGLGKTDCDKNGYVYKANLP